MENTIQNTLVVEEKKEVKKKFKDFYQEKIVNTKISENAERILDFGVKANKVYDNVMLTVGEIALKIYMPNDENANAIMPLVKGLITAKNNVIEFGKNKLIEGKRYIEGKFIKANGNCEDVIIPKDNTLDINQTIDDVSSNIKGLQELKNKKDEETKEKTENKNEEIIKQEVEKIKEGGKTR